MTLYDYMYVRLERIVFSTSVRHKAVVVQAAAKRKQRMQKLCVYYGFAYEYTYQDDEYIIRTVNTKHELCSSFGFPAPSCIQDCSQLS